MRAFVARPNLDSERHKRQKTCAPSRLGKNNERKEKKPEKNALKGCLVLFFGFLFILSFVILWRLRRLWVRGEERSSSTKNLASTDPRRPSAPFMAWWEGRTWR